MKRASAFPFLFYFLFLSTSHAQVAFEKVTGGSAADDGFYIQQTSDKGYIAIGTTSSATFTSGGKDIIVTKTDSNGTVSWSKTYGGSGTDEGRAIQQTNPDGGYIIFGHTDSYGSGNDDLILIKTDNLGDITWTKTYGTSANDETALSMQQTANDADGQRDDGFVMLCRSGSNSYLLIKTDNSGTVIGLGKQYTVAGAIASLTGTIRQTNDDGDAFQNDGFIIVGSDNSSITEGIQVIKTNAIGTKTWWVKCGDPSSTAASNGYSVQQTDDNGDGIQDDGFIVAGTYVGTGGAGSRDVYVLKLAEPALSLQWAYTYGLAGQEFGYSIEQTDDDADGKKDDGYAVTGYAQSAGGQYLLKVASDQSVAWSKTYGGGVARSGQRTTDNGYVLCGSMATVGSGSNDLYLVKTDPLGQTNLCVENNPLTVAIQQTASTCAIIAGIVADVFITTNSYMISPLAISPTSNPVCVTANFSNTTVCIGNTTTFTSLSTGASINSLQWLFGDGSSDLTNNPNPSHTYSLSGTYSATLTVTNALSGSTAVLPVIISALPTVSSSGNTSICNGNATVLSAWGANNFLWTPVLWLNSDVLARVTASPTLAGTYDYTVTGTDVAGCQDDAFITLTAIAAPVVSTSPDITICNTGIASLSAFSSETNYVWTSTEVLTNTTGSTTTFIPVSSGIFSFSVTVTESVKNCPGTDVVIVQVSTVVPVNAGADVSICMGAQASLTATGANSFSWSSGTTPSTGAIVTVSPLAFTSYTVTGTTDNCSGADVVDVSVLSLPTVSASTSNSSICVGGQASLTATGANSFSWSPGTTPSTGAIVTASPTAFTSYTVTGTTDNCLNFDVVDVAMFPLPVVSVSASEDSICVGENVILSVSGALDYSWIPASVSTVSGNVYSTSPSSPTTYILTGTDTNGCVNSTSVFIDIISPNVSAGPDVTVLSGQSVTVQASGAIFYVWVPYSNISCSSCETVTITPLLTSSYTLTGTDERGCSASDILMVVVPVLCNGIFVPNAFSPNGDNNNDLLYAENKDCSYKMFYFAVFNRWGHKVFESTNPMEGWDGKFKGEEAPVGIYVYQLESDIGKLTGNVSLIR